MQPRLQTQDRWPEDLHRDAVHRPLEVLYFFKVQPGMRVLSIRDDGYYTEVLARMVAPEGRVYSHHQGVHDKGSFASTTPTYRKRLANDRLDHVIQLKMPINNIALESGSLDLILLHLNLHDLLAEYGEQGSEALFALFHGWLRDGGTLAIIDHVGRPNARHDLHRLDVKTALPWLWRLSTFRMEHSKLLRNNDDGTVSSLDVVRDGRTDRIVLRLTKLSEE